MSSKTIQAVHLLHLHIIVVVVHEAHQVQEGFDARDVGADGFEFPSLVDAGLGTEVAQEEFSIHLLAVDTRPQAPRVGAPRVGGRGEGGQDDQGDQENSPVPEPMEVSRGHF